MHPPRPGDISEAELIKRMKTVITQGGKVWVKFTCQHCGARQTSETPNTFHRGGYTCEECGKLSHPKGYGMLVMLGNS